jgi:hypothetical protein
MRFARGESKRTPNPAQLSSQSNACEESTRQVWETLVFGLPAFTSGRGGIFLFFVNQKESKLRCRELERVHVAGAKSRLAQSIK